MQEGQFILTESNFALQVEHTKSRFLLTILVMLAQTYLTARVRTKLHQSIQNDYIGNKTA